jgi:hexosaminidase
MKKTGRFAFNPLPAVWVLLFHLPLSGMPEISGMDLLPVPVSLTMNTGRLVIDSSFRIAITGRDNPDLEAAAVRFLNRLEMRTGIPIDSAPVGNSKNAAFEIHCRSKGEKVPSVRTDESYTLEITDNRARLSASNPVGAFRGLETFLQLVDIDADTFFVPSLKIEDHPRFRWRGLLIDVSRHFEPVEIIKRNLDAMAAVKMNVLHWNLSNDQGFRVESKVFPKLHQLGSNGRYYSQSEVREIVNYAGERGIRIVPEFNMPGHSTAWLVAYPELAAGEGPNEIERGWGVFDPCMDPSKEAVYEFLDAFIGEMAGLFPDEYFHIGGDEVKATQWDSSRKIQNFKKSHNLSGNHDLQAYFNQRVLEILKEHGKKMIGWDEILHPELPKSITVQSWRQDSLPRIVHQGYNAILSRGYYLDHMQPASFHYSVDPLGDAASELTEKEKNLILGGEACMWGEFVNPENIESRIWPRAAAIAERLWSPASVNDIVALYRRLDIIDRELTGLGLRHHTLYLEKMQSLAGDTDVRPLLVFADLIKPPILAIRKEARVYYSDTPLNRLVDVIRPESEVARRFSLLVDSRLAFPSEESADSEEIRGLLTEWRANHARLQAILEQSYLLKEIRPLADTVAELCRYGLDALNYLQSRREPPRSWREETAALLKRADRPQAEILIAILPPIRMLIEAACTTKTTRGMDPVSERLK